MRIVYLHQYFKTPQEGGAIRSYHIAKALVDAGIEVEMITAHNSSAHVKKNIDGISVHYIPVFYDNAFGFYKRMFSFFRFIMLSARYASKIKADYCYATSTPLTVGIIALYLKFKNKTPYYFEVRDLWPEAPAALGILKNPVLVGAARWLEKRIYSHAEKIVCLSPGIENSVKKRFLHLDTLRIPNMSDCDFFYPEEKSEAVLKKYNLRRDDLVISYFGALGKVNHLDYLLAAAKICQDRDLPVKFIIAGKGAMEDHLLKMAKSLKLHCVNFTGHLNRQNIRELLNITDAAYISFLNYKILETNSPNKFFDALAAGKMIITNTQGWVKELVDENDCGFYAHPENPPELADKICAYLANQALLETAKINARKLAETRFSKKALTQLLADEFLPSENRASLSVDRPVG